MLTITEDCGNICKITPRRRSIVSIRLCSQTIFRFTADPSTVSVIVLVTVVIGRIYTGDGSSVWDDLGQRTVVRLIICLCI